MFQKVAETELSSSEAAKRWTQLSVGDLLCRSDNDRSDGTARNRSPCRCDLWRQHSDGVSNDQRRSTRDGHGAPKTIASRLGIAANDRRTRNQGRRVSRWKSRSRTLPTWPHGCAMKWMRAAYRHCMTPAQGSTRPKVVETLNCFGAPSGALGVDLAGPTKPLLWWPATHRAHVQDNGDVVITERDRVVHVFPRGQWAFIGRLYTFKTERRTVFVAEVAAA